jgi:hypothetical protein
MGAPIERNLISETRMNALIAMVKRNEELSYTETNDLIKYLIFENDFIKEEIKCIKAFLNL